MYPPFLYQTIRAIRPAPLGVILKKLLGIRRYEHTTTQGRFYVDPCSDIGHALVSRGEYEQDMRLALEGLLGPGAVFVDVGANEGYFSVIGSRLVGPSGRVLAIEPQQRLHPILQRNFQLNAADNVALESAAVSDRDGTSELFLSPEINTGSSGFTKMTRYRLPAQPVKTETLASIFARHGITTIDLMKVDVEGHEYEVILGSKALYETGMIKNIALEIHPHQLATRGIEPRSILDFLHEHGYRINPRFANLVLTHPSRASSDR